uniref:Apple domain-containing protein n=1 Tax=Mesocestoides corti TaxID=53468 RepID=A0A5K3FSY3_MESCO
MKDVIISRSQSVEQCFVECTRQNFAFNAGVFDMFSNRCICGNIGSLRTLQTGSPKTLSSAFKYEN